jgi:uncharacterized protein (DUF924 family)
MKIDAEDILNFWFTEVGPERWFAPDTLLDGRIRTEYGELYEKAAAGDLKKWEETPEKMLALIILLDQFPRRMFRGTAKAYATDETALELARTAIIKHFDDRIDRAYKLIFYLPFEHSEHLGDQRLAIFYIRERTKEPIWVDNAERRLDIIQSFGRFPHRNERLGRESTPEEIAFLQRAMGLSAQA